jgi:hypothetical protein
MGRAGRETVGREGDEGRRKVVNLQIGLYFWHMENTQKPKQDKPDPVEQLMQYQSDVFDLLGQTLNKPK